MTKERIKTILGRLDMLSLGEGAENMGVVWGPVQHVDSSMSVDLTPHLLVCLFLSSAIGGVRNELQVVLGRIEAADYIGNKEDIQIVSDLMDRVQDAIMDYQVSVDSIASMTLLTKGVGVDGTTASYTQSES